MIITMFPATCRRRGVTSREQVMEIQRQLNANGANLKVDGIWGPQTSTVYKAGGGTVSYIPTQYKNALSELQTLLQPQKVQYTPTSEAQYLSQIQAALRPGYDSAIAQRQKATMTNKAEIDADAAARGMGASTWVTDVKDRQSGYEADDIATMEGQYNAAVSNALMNSMQNERANQLAVDQTNAQLTANANSQALSLAGDFYSQYLASAATNRDDDSDDRSHNDLALIKELGELTDEPWRALLILDQNKSNYSKRYSTGAIQKANEGLLEQYAMKFPAYYGG